MLRKTLLALAAIVIASRAEAAPTETWQKTCSGELWRVKNDGLMIDTCSLVPKVAKKVLAKCALGQQCVVTGTMRHCKGVRGACEEMSVVKSIQKGRIDTAGRTQEEDHVCRGIITVWTEGGGDEEVNNELMNEYRLIQASNIQNMSCYFKKDSDVGRKILSVCRMGFPCEVKARTKGGDADAYYINGVYAARRIGIIEAQEKVP
jgi:hypothetical protein